MEVVQLEYRYSLGGMSLVRVDEDGFETVTDSWNPLTGLVKCTSYPLEEREDFATTMAITWARYSAKENEIVQA